MDGIETAIRRMSPGQLRVWKQQLPQRLATMSEPDRESVLRQLQRMPELSDVFGAETKPWQVPSDLPLWRKGLSYAFMPFSVAHEYVAKPLAAGAWAAGVSVIPGVQSGEEQLRTARTGGAITPWHRGFMESYEQAKTPWGVKGILEMLPWLAIPTAGGLAAKAGGLAAKGGIAGRVAGVAEKALKPAVAYEKAIAYPVTKPLSLAGKAISKALTKKVPDLRSFDEVVKVASEPDRLRSLSSVPALKPFAKVIGGLAATAQKPWEWAVVGRNILHAEGINKAKASVSSLTRLGPSTKVFGLDEDGLMLIGSKRLPIQDVIAYERNWTALNPQQKAWVRAYLDIKEDQLHFLKRNNVEVKERPFDEGGHYVGGKVYAQYTPEGELLHYGIVGPGAGKPGIKPGFLKERRFETTEEAVKEGFRYLPPEEEAYLNLIGAYNYVGNKQMGEWLLSKVPWRSTEVFSLPKANNLVNQALRKQPIEKAKIDILRRDLPNVADSLERALAEEDWPARYSMLQDLKAQLRTMEPTAKEQLFWGVERAQKTRRTVEGAIGVIQRAKRGEVIPIGTVKAISRVVPEIREKLTENTRYVLDDLVRAGEEAKRWPITLEVGPAYGAVKKWQTALEIAEAKLAANPQDAALFREVQSLRRKVAFSKFRIAKGEPLELEKSPTSILTEDRQNALNELLDKLRGTPYETTTATGKKVTKYAGGLLDQVRGKEIESVQARKEVRGVAQRTKYVEASLAEYPVFAGKIFTGPEAHEMADFLRKELTPEFSNALHAVNQANAVGRYFALAGDVSPFLIQLILLAGYNPKAYGSAIKGFVQAMFDPQFLDKYLSNNADVVARSPDLVLTSGGIGGFTEAMSRGGWLRKGPFKIAGKLLEPAVRGFDGALTVAGIEMRKSLDYLATNPQRAAQVDAFINEFRGLQNTARIGVSTKQRQLEAAVTLAPKYNRAIVALLTDVLRGNLRGQLARRAVIQGIAAGGALGVAVSYALGERSLDEIAEHFDPRSSKFMTWNVAGQNIGPGSKIRSLLYLVGKSVKDPEALVKGIDENPALLFARANMAPAPSTGLDLLMGKDYIGDPTRDGLLSFTKTVVLENATPLWLQSVLLEKAGGPTQATLNAVAQFVGMRSYPMTPYQELDLKRNELAQTEYGVPTWDDLARTMGTNAQKKLEQKYPELVEMDKKVQERSRGEYKRWAEFEEQARQIDDDTYDRVVKAEKLFADTGDGYAFRTMVEDILSDRRAEFRNRERNFPDILTSLEHPLSPQQMKDMFPGDAARREYYQQMYSDDMWDEYGRYRWDEANKRESDFVAKWGQDMMDYVEESFNIRKWSELPAIKILRQAQELLAPYWEIEDFVWSKYPPEMRQLSEQISNIERYNPNAAKRILKANPGVVYAENLIREMRARIRKANPAVQLALNMFYSKG